MDFSIKASVTCQGEECGEIFCVIINPRNDEITHVVVEEKQFPFTKRIVSIDKVVKSSPKSIQLTCIKAEFSEMDNFIEHHYIPTENSYGVFPVKHRIYIPYSSYSNDLVDVTRERIPDSGIAFHPGTLVKATDGKVGQIDEFLVDPTSEKITHVVIKEGFLWHKKEIAIPASEISHVENDVVQLKISKEQVESLPTIESLMEKTPAA